MANDEHPHRHRSEPDRFDWLAAAWLAGLGSERTRSAYRGDLDRFCSWLKAQGSGSPLDAGAQDLERFQDACAAGGEAKSTMARRMSALRSFYRHAASAGEITASPTIVWSSSAPSHQPRSGLDADAVGALIEAAARLGSRTATLVGLILLNGLRLDEVLACDADDVERRQGSTRISVERRGGHEVPIDRWTAAALSRYLSGRRAGPLLLGESPTRQADRLTRFGADFLIKRAGSAAGIDEPMSSNTLRRSFVARAHASGNTLQDIRDRLGHRDVRTTMRHLPHLEAPAPSPEDRPVGA